MKSKLYLTALLTAISPVLLIAQNKTLTLSGLYWNNQLEIIENNEVVTRSIEMKNNLSTPITGSYISVTGYFENNNTASTFNITRYASVSDLFYKNVTITKQNYNCALGKMEGYMYNSAGTKRDIVSRVTLNKREKLYSLRGDWGIKKCNESLYNVFYIQYVNEDGSTTTTDYAEFDQQDNIENTEVMIEADVVTPINTTTNTTTTINTTVPSFTGSKITQAQAQAGLNHHNMARKEVGVPALEWSAEAAASAQKWADELAATTCKIKHSTGRGNLGENLFWAKGFDMSSPALVASKSWYEEKKDYTYDVVNGNKNTGKVVGHYTQMVWKKTTKVGFGVATCANGAVIVVAQYGPAGNYIGQYPY